MRATGVGGGPAPAISPAANRPQRQPPHPPPLPPSCWRYLSRRTQGGMFRSSNLKPELPLRPQLDGRSCLGQGSGQAERGGTVADFPSKPSSESFCCSLQQQEGSGDDIAPLMHPKHQTPKPCVTAGALPSLTATVRSVLLPRSCAAYTLLDLAHGALRASVGICRAMHERDQGGVQRQ